MRFLVCDGRAARYCAAHATIKPRLPRMRQRDNKYFCWFGCQIIRANLQRSKEVPYKKFAFDGTVWMFGL